MSLSLGSALGLVGCGFAGGLVNAFAGGGTLITFPLLMALGLDPRVANATNIAALWPGVVSATWGYRRDLASHPYPLKRLCLLSTLGGACGAALLVATPTRLFAGLAPYLVWLATLLLLTQEGSRRHPQGPGAKKARPQAPQADLERSGEPLRGGAPGHAGTPGLSLEQALVWLLLGVYGGYFGAGVSIMMLAVCTRSGLHNLHEANAVKNLVGVPMNLVAIVLGAWHGLVCWPAAGLTACGAFLGGSLGARYGRLQHPERVRRLVIGVGILAGLRLYLHGGI